MRNKQSRIKDIAKKAGVSTGTVDRVIHNRGEVSPSTRKKILAIINELDYQPNLLASTLASQKLHHFAVLIPAGSNHNPYWEAPLKGVIKAGEELKAYGVRLDIQTFSQNDINDFRQKGEVLLKNKPDGLLLAPVFFSESKKFLIKCQQHDLPLTFIDTQLDYKRSIRFIGQNSCQSGHVAARLLGMGNPKDASYLVFNITSEKDQLYHFTERYKGFKDYFLLRNLPVNISVHDIHTQGIEELVSILKIALNKNELIAGIFVTGSKVYRIARALKQLGIQNIRLLGFDLVPQNMELLEEEMIDFLISQQPEEQGYQGIQTLYSVIVQKQTVDPVKYSAIDIITRENISHYLNCS
ncbi:MAG: LacI family DNA-binding transcriptional regulator [Bacteroidales bacterium]|nr:LacI family DNA-binding transcriptional regulator [Bacteroidales bacterium]